MREFLDKAIEYATLLPNRDKETYARNVTVHLLGGSRPETDSVRESRAAAIFAMLADIHDRTLTGR